MVVGGGRGGGRWGREAQHGGFVMGGLLIAETSGSMKRIRFFQCTCQRTSSAFENPR